MRKKKGTEIQDRFLSAASLGNLAGVRELWESQKLGLGVLNTDDQTALHLSILGGHAEVASYLIAQDKQGKAINLKNCYGNTPLLLAVRYCPNVVDKLLAVDANADSQNKFGDSSLHQAVHGGYASSVKSLLSLRPKKASSEKKNMLKITPLGMAKILRKENIQRLFDDMQLSLPRSQTPAIKDFRVDDKRMSAGDFQQLQQYLESSSKWFRLAARTRWILNFDEKGIEYNFREKVKYPKQAEANYNIAVKQVFVNRERMFSSPEELRRFVEEIAYTVVRGGIYKRVQFLEKKIPWKVSIRVPLSFRTLWISSMSVFINALVNQRLVRRVLWKQQRG